MKADTPSITHEEWFRMHGTLSEWRVNELLEAHYVVEDQGDIAGEIREGMSPFNAEDFLSAAIELAGELKKHCRGENKNTADRLFAMLEDIAQTTFNAMEYSQSKLNSAIEMLEG